MYKIQYLWSSRDMADGGRVLGEPTGGDEERESLAELYEILSSTQVFYLYSAEDRMFVCNAI